MAYSMKYNMDLVQADRVSTHYLRDRGGSRVLKNWEHDFEITIDQKGPQHGSTFRRRRGGHAHFPAKRALKI